MQMATTDPEEYEQSRATPPSSVKECTDSSTPERVKNVPRIVRLNVAQYQ